MKRVVGLAGETLSINSGVVSLDGSSLDEPYLHPRRDASNFGPFTIPAHHVFVMGDNRTNSSDSRGVLGPVSFDDICGKVIEIHDPV